MSGIEVNGASNIMPTTYLLDDQKDMDVFKKRFNKENVYILKRNVQRKKGIKLSNGLYETEASGGITLNNIRKIAATGVNRISVGKITHSAPSINFKLEI